MTNSIQIAGNGILQLPGNLFWHAQFVFGPDEIEVVPVDGSWFVKQRVPHNQSDNYEVPGSYDIVNLDIGDRTADNVWEMLNQAADSVRAANIEYFTVTQNSNSFVNTLMQALALSFPRSLSGFYEGSGTDVRDQVTFNISGTSGMDWFYAGAKNDILAGGEGDDILSGGGGDDLIRGGIGNDKLNGNADNDQIYGDAGQDTVHGDAGDDVIDGGQDDDHMFGDDGNDQLYGQAGNDELSGGSGADQLFGGVGDDKLVGNEGADVLDGGDGIDTVQYEDSSEGVHANLDTGVGQLGDAEGDSFFFVENLMGSKYADVLSGNAEKNKLEGLDGDDTLVGGDDVDSLYGGGDSDVLVLGNINGVNAAGSASAPEVMDGGAGSDYLVVTGALGSTVKLGKGDAEDRLLVHTDLLGLPDAGGGKIGMLALLGGVYEPTPWSNDYDIIITFDEDANLKTDEQGRQYRQFNYMDSGYGEYNSGSLTGQFGVEYRKYERANLIGFDANSCSTTWGG